MTTRYGWRDAARVWAVRPVGIACRELIALKRVVSLSHPPDWIAKVGCAGGIAFVVFLLVASSRPAVGGVHWQGLYAWLKANPFAMFLGVVLGWLPATGVVIFVTWAAANLVLVPPQVVLFPLLLPVVLVQRLIACRRVLRRMADALGRWLGPREIVEVCRELAPLIPTQRGLEWNQLTADDALSKWLELQPRAWCSRLPVAAWPELVRPGLSPGAMALVFRQCLGQGRPVTAAVLAAAVEHGWFGHATRGPLLVRELGRLPGDRLAAALQDTSALDRARRGRAVRRTFEMAQQINDGPLLGAFQGAIAYLPAEVCEEVLTLTG